MTDPIRVIRRRNIIKFATRRERTSLPAAGSLAGRW
jgi:hypothetical protein